MVAQRSDSQMLLRPLRSYRSTTASNLAPNTQIKLDFLNLCLRFQTWWTQTYILLLNIKLQVQAEERFKRLIIRRHICDELLYGTIVEVFDWREVLTTIIQNDVIYLTRKNQTNINFRMSGKHSLTLTYNC